MFPIDISNDEMSEADRTSFLESLRIAKLQDTISGRIFTMAYNDEKDIRDFLMTHRDVRLV